MKATQGFAFNPRFNPITFSYSLHSQFVGCCGENGKAIVFQLHKCLIWEGNMERFRKRILSLVEDISCLKEKESQKGKIAIYSNSLSLKTNPVGASPLHRPPRKSRGKLLPRIEDNGHENFPGQQNGKLLIP